MAIVGTCAAKQTIEHGFRRRGHREILPISRSFEGPRLSHERARDDAPKSVPRNREIEGDRADAVLLFDRNDVLMRGDLKHAVGRRIDDGLAGAHVLRAEILDNLRP